MIFSTDVSKELVQENKRQKSAVSSHAQTGRRELFVSNR